MLHALFRKKAVVHLKFGLFLRLLTSLRVNLFTFLFFPSLLKLCIFRNAYLFLIPIKKFSNLNKFLTILMLYVLNMVVVSLSFLFKRLMLRNDIFMALV